MKKSIQIFFTATLIFFLSPALAGNVLCDRKIEGVTVKMTPSQVRTIWSLHGFSEIFSPRTQSYRIQFSNRIPKSGKTIQSGKITLIYQYSDDQVSVSKNFTTEKSVTNARIAEFCPNGSVSRKKLHCLISRYGTNIRVEPEASKTPNRCSYQFGSRGKLSTESIRLDKKPEQQVNVNKYGKPSPKRSKGAMK